MILIFRSLQPSGGIWVLISDRPGVEFWSLLLVSGLIWDKLLYISDPQFSRRWTLFILCVFSCVLGKHFHWSIKPVISQMIT